MRQSAQTLYKLVHEETGLFPSLQSNRPNMFIGPYNRVNEFSYSRRQNVSTRR